MSGDVKILDGAFLNCLDTLDLYVHEMKSGHYSGARRSRAYGSSPEFADYREYVQGDDLRRIDWNLAGRFEKYYIKRFIDEKQGRNRIYLDMSASMGMPEQKGMTALRLAAALMYLSVSGMDCVSLQMLSGNRSADLCGNIVGREGFYGAVRKLETLCFAGETDLRSAIGSDPNPGFDDGVTYIISDFLTDSDWKSAVDMLLGRRREVAVIQVLSPQELEPDFSGTQCFCDAERTGDGARIQMDVDRSAMEAYRKTLEGFLADIRRFCASRGVPFMMVRSDERVEDALLTKGCVEELIR
ncbi:MAG: DUF58 domain-containing protein [Clostridia bacterium]|nr:DUF58 domain-containing protein [Clostridia bacterium]